MKYYNQGKVEKVEAFCKQFPFVTVDKADPSYCAFTRGSNPRYQSFIDLRHRPEIGNNAVIAFFSEIKQVPSYEKFVDEFGDKWGCGDIRSMVRESFAWVKVDNNHCDFVGPISDIVDNAPAPVVKDDEEI